SKSAAQRWGEEHERWWYHQLTHPKATEESKREVLTLQQFAPRVLDGHPRANRHKPSGIAAKENIINVHLIPLLGMKLLSVINNEDIQQLKRHLHDRSPKTVNNVLTVLR